MTLCPLARFWISGRRRAEALKLVSVTISVGSFLHSTPRTPGWNKSNMEVLNFHNLIPNFYPWAFKASTIINFIPLRKKVPKTKTIFKKLAFKTFFLFWWFWSLRTPLLFSPRYYILRKFWTPFILQTLCLIRDFRVVDIHQLTMTGFSLKPTAAHCFIVWIVISNSLASTLYK